MNTDAPWPTLEEAEARVLGIQTKLHRWATYSPDRRFDDLFNLVADPAFLTVGWARVRGNRGARTAGVDGVKPRQIVLEEEAFLRRLRDDLKARGFEPLPVRHTCRCGNGTSPKRTESSGRWGSRPLGTGLCKPA